jgi:hypothetical protein
MDLARESLKARECRKRLILSFPATAGIQFDRSVLDARLRGHDGNADVSYLQIRRPSPGSECEPRSESIEKDRR